jgi:hypothetical protein
VKFVKDLWEVEEGKNIVSGSTLIMELNAAKVPAVKSKSKDKGEYHEIG